MKIMCFDGDCPSGKPICCAECEEYETCDDACDRADDCYEREDENGY